MIKSFFQNIATQEKETLVQLFFFRCFVDSGFLYYLNAKEFILAWEWNTKSVLRLSTIDLSFHVYSNWSIFQIYLVTFSYSIKRILKRHQLRQKWISRIPFISTNRSFLSFRGDLDIGPSEMMYIKLSADSSIFKKYPNHDLSWWNKELSWAQNRISVRMTVLDSRQKIVKGPKKVKTTFLCPKIGVKWIFYHNIQKMTCPCSTNYCPG
jgi:hypothetical protein